MLLNVQKLINAPGERMDFQFQLDLSDVDFGGLYPARNPVVVTGGVRNAAGMLLLEFTAETVLQSVCDRCLKSFKNPKSVRREYLLAEKLENGENDDIVLLEDGTQPPTFQSMVSQTHCFGTCYWSVYHGGNTGQRKLLISQ